MAKVIGIGAKINKDKLKEVYLQNSGQKITTKGIKDGWNALKNELDDSLIESLKKTPYYLIGQK